MFILWGLKVLNESPEHGWMELSGVNGGSVLGVGQMYERRRS